MGKSIVAGGGNVSWDLEPRTREDPDIEDVILAHLVRSRGIERAESIEVREIWVALRGEGGARVRRGEILDALSNIAVSGLITVDRDSAIVYPNWERIPREIE